jgi:hypothetical protein
VLRSSVQEQSKVTLDASYLEYCIFGLIKIDLIDLVNTKAILSKNFHIQPSEIDKMPMWEYEYFIKHLNELVKEENNKNEQDMEKYNVNEYKRMANPNSMRRMASNMSSSSLAKIPSLPSGSIPKF